MNNKKVIIMRALPGSGKSTMAKKLEQKAISEGKTTAYCSADDYILEHGKGTYIMPKEISERMALLSAAHKSCLRKFKNAVENNIDLIIVDNTNLTAWEISTYKHLAELEDYKVVINEVEANPAEAFKRQQHGVPEPVYNRMNDSFIGESIPPWWQKEKFKSTTDEFGNPAFDPIPKEENKQLEIDFTTKSAQVNKLIKVANKLIIKYDF